MQAYLLDDFKAEIDERSVKIGGCLHGKPRTVLSLVDCWRMLDPTRFHPLIMYRALGRSLAAAQGHA